MKWNHEWPEPECCRECGGVISSRRLRECGRCGADLDPTKRLDDAKVESIRVEIDGINVARVARTEAERAKRERDRSSLSTAMATGATFGFLASVDF